MLADTLSIGTDWVSVIAGVATIILFLAACYAFFVRRFHQWLKKELQENGGDTLAVGDTLGRIEQKTDETRGMMLAHLVAHPGTATPPPELLAPTRDTVVENIAP